MREEVREITKEVFIYIAEDGKEFEDWVECEQYEDELNFRKLISESVFTDEDENRISDFRVENWVCNLEYVVDNSQFIRFKNENQREKFQYLVEHYLNYKAEFEGYGLEFVYDYRGNQWISFENIKSIFNSMEEMLNV